MVVQRLRGQYCSSLHTQFRVTAGNALLVSIYVCSQSGPHFSYLFIAINVMPITHYLRRFWGMLVKSIIANVRPVLTIFKKML
jgi:hypothetical protein